MPRVRRFCLWLTALLLVLAGGSPFGATAAPPLEDKIWTGIIMADTAGKDGPIRVGNRWPGAMAGREKQLQRIFGYRHFRVLGHAQRRIKTGEEDWLVPSRRFYLKVNTKSKTPGGYLMNLQLWQEQKMLVEADIKIGKTGPLYIRGPQVGGGQLIIVVVCGGKENAWVRALKPKLAIQPAATPATAVEPK